MPDSPQDTGLVCPKCQRPVAVLLNRGEGPLVFKCLACFHVWRDQTPDSKPEGTPSD
jgi:uncharacterized Zn finger protein